MPVTKCEKFVKRLHHWQYRFGSQEKFDFVSLHRMNMCPRGPRFLEQGPEQNLVRREVGDGSTVREKWTSTFFNSAVYPCYTRKNRAEMCALDTALPPGCELHKSSPKCQNTHDIQYHISLAVFDMNTSTHTYAGLSKQPFNRNSISTLLYYNFFLI